MRRKDVLHLQIIMTIFCYKLRKLPMLNGSGYVAAPTVRLLRCCLAPADPSIVYLKEREEVSNNFVKWKISQRAFKIITNLVSKPINKGVYQVADKI